MTDILTQDTGTAEGGAPVGEGSGGASGRGSGTDSADRGTGSSAPSPQADGTAPSDNAPDLAALRASLANLPADQIAAILKDTPYVSEVSRTVRRSWVQQEAQKLARELVGKESPQLTKRLTDAETRLAAYEKSQEDALLSGMSDNERRAHLADKRATELESENKRLKGFESAVEEEQAKMLWLDDAKGKYGLDEKDVATLTAIDDPETLILKLLDIKDGKEKEARKVSDSLTTRLDALERRLGGGTTFAAGAPTSPGGEMSYEDLRGRYASGDATESEVARFNEEYRKRRS